MKRLFKIFLLPALLLLCGLLGLWHALGQRERNPGIKAANSSHRRFDNVTAGAFVLKNVTLRRMNRSAILKGEFINQTNHYLDEATFEIKAYDREGRLLKGAEEKTIFAVHQLKANASTSLNYGYGVWLQGISPETIARIELLETSDEPTASFPIRAIPLASHALAWKKDSELEE